MSIISDSIASGSRHAVLEYVSGTSAPNAGQRLAKIILRGQVDAAGEAIKSKCVSIPHISIDAVKAGIADGSLVPYVMEYLESIQDTVIKVAVLNGMSEIHSGIFSINACLEFLDSKSESTRLTKEVVQAFYSEKLAAALVSLCMASLGVSSIAELSPAKQGSLLKTTKSVEEDISKLAGGATLLPDASIGRIRRVIQTAISSGVLSSEDSLLARLNGKLDAMEKKNEEARMNTEELLDLL